MIPLWREQAKSCDIFKVVHIHKGMEPCFCQKFDLLTQTSEKITEDRENNFKSQVIKLKF